MSGTADRADDRTIAAFLDDVAGVPASVDELTVKRRSRDFFWYSPVLNAELHGKTAQVVVTPRDEADVLRVAGAAARHRLAMTPRGGGTGNYGQCVPLAGGVVVDLSAMTRVEWTKPGLVRCEPGLKMVEFDALTRPSGWELRMHPSTKKMATIGGFVAGGSGGIGSVTYGGLREPGNIIAARIVTAEAEPRTLELRGDAAQIINRAYGTTGIITALEMPLAPAWEWVELIVAFPRFLDAVSFGREVAFADGIVKKLLSPITWPLPRYFTDIKAYCPEGRSLLVAMIARPSLESFKSLLAGRGEITLEREFDEAAAHPPIYEYTWNHTTLHVLKQDRSVTYLQNLFPSERLLESVEWAEKTFGDEVLHHLEFIRFGGRVTASALPVVRYTSEARLNEIIRIYEANGVMIANPHVYTLEDGSRHKRADADQLGFKQKIDPYGLLNPGKMRSFEPKAA